MTDSHLRDLERRFRQSGSPDDEAAWLKERVRVGDLTQERLELAAYCGHEGARRAVECDPDRGTVRQWGARLAQLGGRALVVRALTAISRQVIDLLPSDRHLEGQQNRRQALAATLSAIELWLHSTNSRTRASVLAAHRQVPVPERAEHRCSEERLLGIVAHAVSRAVEAVATGDPSALPRLVSDGLGYSLNYEAQGLLPKGFVMSVLRSDVVPWALGTVGDADGGDSTGPQRPTMV